MGYRDTLNLPKTDFPMRANLAQKEPDILAGWNELDLYGQIQAANAAGERYILHDGPPYANGKIHIGHALNKILKDFIIKSKNMQGCLSPYIPGWDCHGLPIEHKVAKLWQEKGKQPESDQVAFREECRRYARKYLDIQRDEFRRLGVLGDWANSYYTMSNAYESAIAREFGKFVGGGYVVEGLKPVYWCASCKTALAEAEVEYHDHSTPSIFVKFEMITDLTDKLPETAGKKVSVVIWTTTPWTIPANMGLMFHPEYDYVAVDVGDEVYILAERLAPVCLEQFGIENYKILTRFKADILEGAKAQHPFMERESQVVLADFVTLDSGSGIVHTAPGHGQEDYEVGLKYGLEIFAPVDDEGKFTDEVPQFAGQNVFAANPAVNALLKEKGALLHKQDLVHSYPHCWRCKEPIIFRAAKQWFVTIDHNNLRGRLLEEIGKTAWIPAWGEKRIRGMVENRPDWCISRQRAWGIPIMAFHCRDCQTTLIDRKLIDHIADLFATEGSDAWFKREISELLPAGTVCPNCQSADLEKDQSILDVWFDSGVSHAAVCESNDKLGWPVDLYLEGSDQHRGWFNSALTTAVVTRDAAPYRAVLTHGFVMSMMEEGQKEAPQEGSSVKSAKYAKMSKSLGNVVSPQEVWNKYGADILRLWVSAEDYRDDTHISQEILKRLSEAYRRIRNTWRFLLGNLKDFEPETRLTNYADFPQMDRWILHRLHKLVKKTRKAYDDFEFHLIYQAVHNFCAVDLSAVYLDIAKDRMYCSDANNPARRAGQSTMFTILDTTLRLMAPILSFTTEEVYASLPGAKLDSVHLTKLPEVDENLIDDELGAKWSRMLEIRSEVNKTIEKLRAEKTVGQSLDAEILLHLPESLRADLDSLADDDGLGKYSKENLRRFLIVSAASCVEQITDEGAYKSDLVEGLAVLVSASDQAKCDRCWTHEKSVGQNSEHPTLCARCVSEIDPQTREKYEALKK